jgi:thiol:disulfide interchange protein DsbA
MHCKDIDALLDTHRVGQLNAAGKAEVADHLAHCRRCADAWFGHEALAGETPAAPRADFYAEAMAAAIAGGTAGSGAVASAGGSRRWRAALGLAAAAVIAAGMVWLALPDDTAEQTTLTVDDSAESSTDPGTGNSAESSRPEFVGNTPVRDLDPPAVATIETPSARYVAGVHYERLPVPAPTSAADGQIEICEFFMFGCVHCYDFEPILTSWVDANSDKIDFVRVPALFNEVAVLHAQAYYTAEALGAADDFVGPFYSAIHEGRQALSTAADIRDFFVRHGVDAARFDSTFNSEAVRRDLQRAAELNRLYRVDATPTIGVAGKYRTNASILLTGWSNSSRLRLSAVGMRTPAACRRRWPRG